MAHSVGLDVSQKMTAICALDAGGGPVWRGVCATDPDLIETAVRRHAGHDANIGVETGAMGSIIRAVGKRPASRPHEDLATHARQDGAIFVGQLELNAECAACRIGDFVNLADLGAKYGIEGLFQSHLHLHARTK